MGSKSSKKTRINPYLRNQSEYALGSARDLFDRNDPLPSQYTGIDPIREQALQEMRGLSQYRNQGRQSAFMGDDGQTMVPGRALAEWEKTVSGGYLNDNQYLDDIVSRAASASGAAPVGGFASQGRFGSGAMANAVADATQATAAKLYGANYEAERGRMMDMLNQSSTMNQLQYADLERDFLNRERDFENAQRLEGVGRQYEEDQNQQNLEALRQYLHPYVKQQMFEGSLGASPLNNESDVTTKTGFDWGSALMSLIPIPK